MARFNTVLVGSVYLSRDGTIPSASNPGCKVEVKGLAPLAISRTGQTIIAIDGTPYVQTLGIPKGGVVSILVPVMTKTLFNQLRDVINGALSGATTIALTITGDTGDYYLAVYPSMPDAFQFTGEFWNERIHDVTLNFVVSTTNHTLTSSAGSIRVTGAAATLTKSP